MTDLLHSTPYAARDDVALLAEMNTLSHWHLQGCEHYRAIWPTFEAAGALAELPYLHVSAFKHRLWRTRAPGVSHQRTLKSSSTGGTPSQIVLDAESSALQARSSTAILTDFLGTTLRPLLILDEARALVQRGEVSARIAAAMGLKPLASQIHFLLRGTHSPQEVDWDIVRAQCDASPQLLVYGFTWILWTGWAQAAIPPDVVRRLSSTQVHFVHSGGWKRLEAIQVERHEFDRQLLAVCGPNSQVVDFYGLVEQVGLVYPLCTHGRRHIPRWGAVLVRDPWTLETLDGQAGMLQFLNPLARGAPYHNVLTEDWGRLTGTGCDCGRAGTHFELIGRMPKAEVRGCANV